MSDVELTVSDLRPELARFAILMERKLRENDHKNKYSRHRDRGGGECGWVNCPLHAYPVSTPNLGDLR